MRKGPQLTLRLCGLFPSAFSPAPQWRRISQHREDQTNLQSQKYHKERQLFVNKCKRLITWINMREASIAGAAARASHISIFEPWSNLNEMYIVQSRTVIKCMYQGLHLRCTSKSHTSCFYTENTPRLQSLTLFLCIILCLLSMAIDSSSSCRNSKHSQANCHKLVDTWESH